MLRPSQQPAPDSYLHVVERKSDGIVVRDCKVHITFATVADEILVVTTRTLRTNERIMPLPLLSRRTKRGSNRY